MLNLHKSETLVNSFTPEENDTNVAQAIVRELSETLVNLSIDHYLDNTSNITNEDLITLSNTISWFRRVFCELEA